MSLKKSFFPLFLILFSFHTSDADAQVLIASLAGANYHPADTVRARILYDKGREMFDSAAYQQALDYFREAQIILEEQKVSTELIADTYHQAGRCLHNLQDYENAITDYQKSIKIREELVSRPVLKIATLYNNIGWCYHNLGFSQNSIEHHEIALDLRRSILEDRHLDVYYSYQGLAYAYYSSDLDKCIELEKKGLQVLLNLEEVDTGILANAYFDIGHDFFQKEAYEDALEYFSEAVQVYQKDAVTYQQEIITLFSHIGSAYYNLDLLDKARNSFRQAQFFVETFAQNDSLNKYIINWRLGTVTGEDGRFLEAATILEETMKEFGPTIMKDTSNMINLMIEAAHNYLHVKKLDKSNQWLVKAQQLADSFADISETDKAFLSKIQGELLEFKRQFDDALFHYQKAFSIYSTAFGMIPYPSLELLRLQADVYVGMGDFVNAKILCDSIIDTLKNQTYVDALTLLGNAYKTKGDAISLMMHIDSSSVRESIEMYDSCFYFLRASQQFAIKKFNTIQFFHTNIHYIQLIEKALGQHLKIGTEEMRLKAYQLLSSNRALSLYSRFHEVEALTFAGIPDSLQEMEQSLRIDINYYDKKLQERIAGTQKLNEEAQTISSKLYNLNIQYIDFQKYIRDTYPDYYRLKFDLTTVSVDFIQDTLLGPNQSLLEYFIGDSSIFIFLFRPDHFEVHQIAKDARFDQWVEDMTRNGIYGYYNAPSAQQSLRRKERTLRNYTNAAYQLYRTLILPIKDQLTEEVIFIPDGILGYIPFEALLTEQPPSPSAISAYQYLIEDHQISYCYSATLLREMQYKQPRHKPERSLLTMAPFYLDNADSLVSHIDTTQLLSLGLRDTLAVLPATGPETAAIAQLFGGQSFFGDEAKVDRFISEANNYRMLHLATHGQADDRVGDYAYLAFSFPEANNQFDKLYARDIYALSLNADLVVLSACETGIGRLQRGEGILSMARAFAYAGAKSIVTSLWKVSDIRTQDLMTGFYKYLKAGKSKDQALRLTKLDFLRRYQGDPELTHPFFWSAFIGIGDMSPVR